MYICENLLIHSIYIEGYIMHISLTNMTLLQLGLRYNWVYSDTFILKLFSDFLFIDWQLICCIVLEDTYVNEILVYFPLL